ncbi:hypothetical protein FNV43_RR09593 [Rhamnella rubrinervis]|uniref:Uncharacterized protein n=1 Tax=Rhamnella rubrinervis TaxID=2594499 RepID=A0A8K0HA90_9ROSA|nr:hypothetical protein FNV43_RR09593 [Rhamnella rubrinervis]
MIDFLKESFEFNEDVITMSALDAQMRRSFRTWRSDLSQLHFMLMKYSLEVLPEICNFPRIGLEVRLAEMEKKVKILLELHERQFDSFDRMVADMEGDNDTKKWRYFQPSKSGTVTNYALIELPQKGVQWNNEGINEL